MRRESYFYDLISRKRDQRIYGDTPYASRIGDILNLYEELSSLEKLELQEAIRKLLKSGDSILIEIAMSICTGFMEMGLKKQQQYKELQRRILDHQ